MPATIASSTHPEAAVDPSARIDPTARIERNVRVEAEVIVGPHCVIGEGTRLRVRSIIVAHTTMGRDNDVHPYAVLGNDPQDRAYDPSKPNALLIGDRNIFREFVTVGRGTGDGPPTRIGSGCMLMSSAHVGHNSQIGDDVVMANSTAIAGHVTMGSRVVTAGGAMVHQFCHIGDGVMFRGNAAASQHVPPFVVIRETNLVAGLNAIGLRRDPAITEADQRQLKKAYRAIYRSRGGRNLHETLDELEADDPGPAALRFVGFIRHVLALTGPGARGICAGFAGRGDTGRSRYPSSPRNSM